MSTGDVHGPTEVSSKPVMVDNICDFYRKCVYMYVCTYRHIQIVVCGSTDLRLAHTYIYTYIYIYTYDSHKSKCICMCTLVDIGINSWVAPSQREPHPVHRLACPARPCTPAGGRPRQRTPAALLAPPFPAPTACATRSPINSLIDYRHHLHHDQGHCHCYYDHCCFTVRSTVLLFA